MRFGSVCSGIEAASVAWGPLGWEAAWLSEIEPFPSAVLAHHYPNVSNLGNMTALPDRIRSGEVEAPDLFCGGTPCQAFSVAGLRNSLDDARGNLSLVFCEIANAIDEVRSVRGLDQSIIFWENVPGVLSTKDNAFGCFLAGLAGEDDPLEAPGGKWTNAGYVLGPKRAVAWRVLDAQYFGVAQRRKRVFVVASAREDFDPAAVLFEFDGLRRDTAPSRKAGKATAASAGAGATNRSWPAEVSCTLDTTFGTKQGLEDQHVNAGCPLFVPGPAVTQFGDMAGMLTARHDSSPCADRGMNVVAQPISYGIRTANTSSNGWGIQEEVTHTLDTTQGVAVAQPIGIFQDSEFGVAQYDSAGTLRAGRIPEQQMVMQPMPINTMVALRHEALGEGTGFGIGESGDPAYTLTKGHSHAVAQPIGCFKGGQGEKAGGIGYDEHLSPTLSAADSGSNRTPTLMQGMQVRRLTPVECERLQGFPDGYTAIPWRNKPASECPDGPRYKALGNSWAVPVVRWIGERIAKAA